MKVVRDVSKLEYAIGVDTFDLTAKKDFVSLKDEVDKKGTNKLVNVSTSLNNLKAKVDELDVVELKIVPMVFKKVGDVVKNEVAKNIKFNTLKTKINKLKKKIYLTTLIHTNQYNTDKRSLEKKNGDVDKKIPGISGSMITTVQNTKIKVIFGELFRKTDYDAKISEINGRYLTSSEYI